MSTSAYVWKERLDFPYMVRAKVGKVSNEIVGSYQTIDMAKSVAKRFPDARVIQRVTGQVWDVVQEGEVT